ncbi:hypothetical protein [uncultured Psychroserpens sp.]|uniref:hypothetical protein n=1 Tax=uncultured Psychroserpens sp. TaxID=255436 RepID=UPI0026120E76|nr:hypothetical protein [uncultured Psychroserpens sp.]
MKKILIVLCVTLCIAFKGFAQDKKVAVVSFYTDKIIGFSELDAGGEELLASVLKLRDNPDFDLTPILEQFHTEFFDTYAKKFPFELLPEDEVTKNQAYIDFKPKYEKDAEELKRYVVYPGYKYIYDGFAGKDNEVATAKMFSDKANGVMFVEIHFDLTKGFGIGGTATVKMRANARITMYDKSGKKLFVINEGANSKKTSVMVKGIPVMSTKKILPMCESALERLMKDLNKRLPKIIKKAKKLK